MDTIRSPRYHEDIIINLQFFLMEKSRVIRTGIQGHGYQQNQRTRKSFIVIVSIANPALSLEGYTYP